MVVIFFVRQKPSQMSFFRKQKTQFSMCISKIICQSLLFQVWSLAVQLNDMRVFVDCSPAALKFDSKIVAVHPDSEEAILAPVSSVAVPADPILHIVLFSPSNNRNLVILVEDELRLWVYASSIGLPFISRIDSAGNRPSCEDFCLHPFRALH